MIFNVDNYVEREPMSGCWLWTKAVNKLGYGIKSGTLAHRFVYKFFNADSFDSTLDVMHICHNRCCVNPSHLRQGTRQENVMMSVNDGRWNNKLRSEKQSEVRNRNKRNGHIVGAFRKVTDEQVRHIRAHGVTSDARKELANQYGITPTAVRSIQVKKAYKYVL